MMSKRYTLLIAAVIIGMILFAALSFPQPVQEREIHLAILTTSDLQSRIFPPGIIEGVESPGLSAIAETANRIRAEEDYSLLLSSGDDLIGAPYSLFHGEPEYRGMTRAGYDAVCPGNHEFGFGESGYARAAGYAGFPIVSANMIVTNETLSHIIKPWAIIGQDELKIGIFGLMTPKLCSIAPTGPGITVTDPCVAAEEAVRSLRNADVDVIICLSHMGEAEDTRLAENVAGIHAIIGGHDHIVLQKEVRDPDNRIVPIVQAGQYGDDLGILRLTLSYREVINWSFEVIKPEGEDAAVSAVLAPFITAYEEEMKKPVGEISFPLDTRKMIVRGGEAEVGDLITDAWRDWFPEADIAFINGGSIRGDRVFSPGPVSWGMMQEILPFGSELVLVQMTGREIRDSLEISASALRISGDEIFPGERPPTGGFLQVSGIRFTIDTEGDPFTGRYEGKSLAELMTPGRRVSRIEVLEARGWEEMKEDQCYTVVVNSWLASGGDGHYAIAEAAGSEYVGTTVRDIDPVIVSVKWEQVERTGWGGRIQIK
ncbi:bifunctional metallophosphatase/5'-nucleotidase [Methanocalculus sp. MC3]